MLSKAVTVIGVFLGGHGATEHLRGRHVGGLLDHRDNDSTVKGVDADQHGTCGLVLRCRPHFNRGLPCRHDAGLDRDDRAIESKQPREGVPQVRNISFGECQGSTHGIRDGDLPHPR